MTAVVMLGAGFIGQMHSLSLKGAALSRRAPAVAADPAVLLEVSANRALADDVAGRFGWRSVILDDWLPSVTGRECDMFINAGPNDIHAEPNIAAAEAGKHVFSEKPLARSADEALAIWQAAHTADVHHACAFMHRFIPALQLARTMIADGAVGNVLHYRSQFLIDMREPDGHLSWRYLRDRAGGGAVSDLGSHHIDVARFLVGEVVVVGGRSHSWSKDPDGRAAAVNDDAFAAVAELDGGVTAVFEASRITGGHALTGRIEVDGTDGSLRFDMERLNELIYTQIGEGPRRIFAIAKGHPYADFFLPVGIQGAHSHGWTEIFAFQMHHFLSAVQHGGAVAPIGATFEDGYRVAEIVDTIIRSNESGRMEAVAFRTPA